MDQTHQREAAIFDAAMELPPEQRATHLEHACGGDAVLRQRLESLLKACESSCDFLDSPVDPGAAEATNVLPRSFEKAGDRIGRYKLLQQIGEGGCGVVYMAEQEEPVSRRVALKVIKLGLDTKSVIARFEAERQALALMDHPNIAKVLDAGATEPGRPYFVMELVRGLKITEYCDEARLSTKARLDLFIQVCQAIQHAHQKGIIHRDIKPSNILVTINDGVPVPKVIDFGIAKATGGLKLTDKTVFTAFEQFIGTPAYMSPEQAVLTSLDIDTRSDIYALGVLLYELLTGKTPFDAKELFAAGLDEMRRTIREQEPQRPSTRISTLAQDELSTTAQRRGIDAPKLVSELRGDLDWIVMKALEKDRAHRYETANGLAADIKRHLDNEPVVACPPSRLYRFQKMVRRNKLAFAAGSAVAASLVIGLTMSTVLFFRERAARKHANEQEASARVLFFRERAARKHANEQEASAREQAAIAQAVNDFLQNDLLLQASSYSQAEAGFTPEPNLTVREALERAAKRIGDRFKERPLEEAAVQMSIGNAFRGVGEVERGIAHLQRTLELRRGKLGPDNPYTLYSMSDLASAYADGGKVNQALPLLEETLKLMKANLKPDHPETLEVMNNLAWAYRLAGKLDLALPLFEETLKLRKAKLGPDHRETLGSMNNLAMTYRKARKLDQALSLLEETLKLMKASLGPNDPYTQNAMINLAYAYRDAGKLDQALPLFEEALKLRKATLGPDHPNTQETMNDLAMAYQAAGKFDLAVPLAEQTLKLEKAKLGPENRHTLGSMVNLAIAYGGAGKLDQALALAEETVKLTKARLGLGDPWTQNAMFTLAQTYHALAKYDLALPLFEETLKLYKVSLGPDDPYTQNAMRNLAQTYRAVGKPDLALPLYEETLKLQKTKLGPDDPGTLWTMNNLASVYREAGKLDQALPLFEETVKLRKARLGPDDPDTLWSMNGLADVRARRGQFAEAAADLSKAKAARLDDHQVWHQLAALLVASGQLEVYREHCRKSVERFGNSTDPITAERIAKDCLMLPASGADLDVAAKMADTAAAAAATNHWATPWFQLVKGLAEYRQGRFASAVEWVNRALTETGKELERDVQAYMVLAMAHYELKQTDQARAALAKGAEIERTKLPKLESGDIGSGWLDWIIAHALMREAKALIEGVLETKAETK